jgi:hypothetical protein
MDWMTLSITAIGALIFCLWVVIPIGEYREIYRRIRERSDGEPHT